MKSLLIWTGFSMRNTFFEQLLGWSILITVGMVMGIALALAAFTIGYLTTLIPVLY